ncbi:MAG TPA: hypothetical protein VGL99_23115 [Chloroflexota bacterium]|jgi:hypothetical protein
MPPRNTTQSELAMRWIMTPDGLRMHWTLRPAAIAAAPVVNLPPRRSAPRAT